MQDGRLSLHDLALRVDGGRLAGDFAVEAEAGTAEVMVRLSANDIPVGDLLRDFGATEKVMGEIDTVDLGEETFDLLLRPLPKTQKLSTLAVPVEIEGTFAEPKVKPRTGTAVAQAARGVLGGLLIPLNQISALFGQETADACAEAMRQAQERQEQRATEAESPT